MVSGIKRKVQSLVWGCVTCQKQARRQFNPVLGTRKTKSFIPERVFGQVSLDPIGEFLVKPFENSRARTKVYPLIFLDPQIGYVHCELIPSLKARQILIAILNVQATFSTKVEYIISDKGTLLQDSALRAEMEEFEQGIQDLCASQNGIKLRNQHSNAQFRNPFHQIIKTICCTDPGQNKKSKPSMS